MNEWTTERDDNYTIHQSCDTSYHREHVKGNWKELCEKKDSLLISRDLVFLYFAKSGRFKNI